MLGTLCTLSALHVLWAQYGVLDLSLETHSPANMPFRKARQKEIASIQLSCKPGSVENCHFFGIKESILKLMRKGNGLIYLDASVFL